MAHFDWYTSTEPENRQKCRKCWRPNYSYSGLWYRKAFAAAYHRFNGEKTLCGIIVRGSVGAQ